MHQFANKPRVAESTGVALTRASAHRRRAKPATTLASGQSASPDGVRMLKRLKQHREAVDAPSPKRRWLTMSASKSRVDADKPQPPLQVPLRDSESQAN